ncbi:hypothetical protein M514_03414 [Trichuris suis]|uniref:Uncharacterized protein n=1 Tax=Trichuris suis TaxID=68888 RepID=A0A085NF31_9BILA|nr:hypothetical protein M513_03414 [Trichuris suis]KFD68077.1 hypothetical protein M514_03414 [Trichuris suis]
MKRRGEYASCNRRCFFTFASNNEYLSKMSMGTACLALASFLALAKSNEVTLEGIVKRLFMRSEMPVSFASLRSNSVIWKDLESVDKSILMTL